jgi:serine phosphatase RsbU (regulator of sigma subunit)
MRFELRPGSRLTFYSDGVVEAQNQEGELFGFDRAKAISTKTTAAIADAAVKFGQSDDITVVAIERLVTNEAPITLISAPIPAPA